VFDSYVVMHYDPKKENTELTKKEKEKAKNLSGRVTLEHVNGCTYGF